MSKFCPFFFPSIRCDLFSTLMRGSYKRKKEWEKYKARERWGKRNKNVENKIPR